MLRWRVQNYRNWGSMARDKMLSLRITPIVVKAIDELVDARMYMSRSEAVRDAIMELVRRRFKPIKELSLPLDLPQQEARYLTITVHVPPTYAQLIREMVKAGIFLDKASLIRRAIRVYFDEEGFTLLALAKREESKEHSEES